MSSRRRGERPLCCIPGWSGSCGGTCDYAAAEQEALERRAWEREEAPETVRD